MANPDRSIDPRLLDAARQEFLSSSYANASIRKICADAGVTTGALYNRYKTKKELFDALVSPTIEELRKTISAYESEELQGIETSGSVDAVWTNPKDNIRWLMEYMYDHYDVFRLVFCCAEGTAYDDFLHKMTENACQSTLKVMGLAHKKGLIRYMPEEDELHVLMTAYYAAVAEPVKHGFSKEKALRYCESLDRLFDWRGFFG